MTTAPTADLVAQAPAEPWAERDARLAAQRREAADRKAQAVADGIPHEPGDETFIIGWLDENRPIVVKVCNHCGCIASNGETCAQAEQYVQRVRLASRN